MLTSLIRFAFISFLFSSAVVFSADNTSISTEPSTAQVTPQPISNSQLPEWFYRELASIRQDISVLDATGASKEQIQELKERIGKVEVRLEESQLRVDGKLNEQSGRIGDINASIDQFGIMITVLGLVASAIAVLFGWISAGRKAKLEAKRHVDDWLESNKAELDAQLVAAKEKLETTLESEIASAKKQIEKLISSSKGKIETVETRMDSLENAIFERVTSSLGKYNLKDFSKEERQDIEEHAEAALTKSEEERTAMDWKLLAVEANLNELFDDALGFINKALVEQEFSSDFENADSLYLKAHILGNLKRTEDCILICEELFKQFYENEDITIHELVLKALYFKGMSLNQQNRLEEEISVYDEIFELFKGNKEASIQKQVAMALYAKGFRLGELNRSDEEVVVYEEVSERFKDSRDTRVQEIVVMALYAKAFRLYRQNFHTEAMAELDQLIKKYGNNKESEVQKLIQQAKEFKTILQSD